MNGVKEAANLPDHYRYDNEDDGVEDESDSDDEEDDEEFDDSTPEIEKVPFKRFLRSVLAILLCLPDRST